MVRKIRKPIKKRPSYASMERTDYIWERFQSGESISSIASDMEFAQTTILNHLKAAFDMGRPLRVGGLLEVSILTPEERELVINSFDEHGTSHLKPVFDALEGAFSYDQLHVWRLVYLVRMGEKGLISG